MDRETRETALKVIYKIDKENSYSNIVLNEFLKNRQTFK